MQKFELNEKQKQAVEMVAKGKNFLVSGPGGVGKSVFIRHIKELFEDSTVFLAPTGIAALNIGGATIHSTFKFPHEILTKKHYKKIEKKAEDLFVKTGPIKRIVIDEISMVRLDVMHTIDQQLRKIRRDSRPFGGLQVIVVGDFYQLPPVVTKQEKKHFFDNYDSEFAFGDSTWSEAGFEYIEFDQIMRQSDEEFIKNLQNVRTKKEGYRSSIDYFNRIGLNNQVEVLDQDPTFLCCTNRAANSINQSNYQELEEEEHVYYSKKEGKFSAEPAPEILKLKFGTKVLMTVNTEKFKNGQIGYVVGFLGNDIIQVMLEEDESTINVEKYKWEEREYKVSGDNNLSTYPVGSYTQFPIRYGWAVTIHKCQGLTLPCGIIDIGNGAFTSGQTYVALSRIKELKGLALFDKLSYNDVIVSREIQEFYANDCKGIGLF